MATPSTPGRTRRAVRRRFTEAKILSLLREAAAGTPVMDLCWNHCISRSTFRAWKAKYGAASDVKAGRLQQLELENARLRNALARANSELERTQGGQLCTTGQRARKAIQVPSNNGTWRLTPVTDGG